VQRIRVKRVSLTPTLGSLGNATDQPNSIMEETNAY
jgi:hypothetical protein